jgi:hypothetical protein
MQLLTKYFTDVFDATLSMNGFGESVDDPIVINAGMDCVAIEYKIIAFINSFENKKYRVESQQLIDRGAVKIDKVTVVFEDESNASRSYFFDISKSS